MFKNLEILSTFFCGASGWPAESNRLQNQLIFSSRPRKLYNASREHNPFCRSVPVVLCSCITRWTDAWMDFDKGFLSYECFEDEGFNPPLHQTLVKTRCSRSVGKL